MPKITVGIPVYNAEKTIARAIQSVLNQTYTDFELIITDDGSTDGTLQVIQSFDDSRIRLLLDKENKGISYRLNQQIAMAQGEYFARMDADDIMFPNRLERQIEVLEQHPEIDVLGSSVIVIGADNKIVGSRGRIEDGELENVDSFIHPTAMGKTSWFRANLYNVNYSGWEDYELWLRTARNSCFKVINEPLLFYNDPQKYRIKQYTHRRLVGNKVLLNEKHLFSNKLIPYLKVLKNYYIIVAVFFVHLLHLDGWAIAFRNKKLSSEKKQFYRKKLEEIIAYKTRILHVITSLRTGGAEHLMVDLLPRLRNLGNHVEIAVFDGTRTSFYEQLEAEGIKIHAFAVGGSVYSVKHIFKLRKLMKNFDVVHTHNTACQMFAALGKTKRNILITTEHSTSTRRRNYRIFKYIDRWMYKRYDKIICISEPSEKSLRGYIGDAYPIVTVQNGIDVARFANAQPIDLGLKGKKLITMVAGFRYEKDHPTVIRCLQYLPQDYHVVFVGDGEKRAELEALIAELGLVERVHLLGIRTDVPQILKSSDVIVMSSHREGLSLSNVEGMSSGNPFVASDVEGLREVTKGYGVLFPHGDSETLAKVVLKLTTDLDYRNEVSLKCKERALQYDIQVMAENYNRVYCRFAT